MASFMVKVTGRADIPHPAERALLNLVVASSGATKASVSDEVITTAKHVESLLRELSPQDETPEAKKLAALAHWSKTSLSATSQIPWHDGKGTPPDRRYDAKIHFDIRFKDFKELGVFGSRLSALEFVEISSIQWLLTVATERSYRSRLRKEATRDALQKARDYCEVLGCTNLRPVELEEQGVRISNPHYGSHGSHGSHQPQMRAQQTASFSVARKRSVGGSQAQDRDEDVELEFTPESVRMNMEVTLTFQADPTDAVIGREIEREEFDEEDMVEL